MSTRGITLSMPPTPCKRATGLTMAELECVVAVASCPAGTLATRQAIRAITGAGRSNLPSVLVDMGVLRRVDTIGRIAVYAVARSWLRSLGIEDKEAA